MDFDELLLEILKKKKNVVGFLETVFDFLSRRTDFFIEMQDESEGMGFPPGMKENIVLDVLHKLDQKNKQMDSLPIVNEIEISTSTNIDENIEKSKPEIIKSKDTQNVIKSNKEFQSNEFYNGAAFENYSWSQTISDVELNIRLPTHLKTSKQISVKIEKDFIEINDKIDGKTVFGGKICSKIKNHEAVWSLSSGQLHITIDKIQVGWWKRFLETEPEIDLGKMDCSRPLEELPQESQVAVEKLRWDAKQKALGLPTSEQIKNRELLRTAWDLEGSPFKGQPFDPTAVEFN